MTTAETSTSETSQMRFLGIVWKVALLLLYTLAFAGLTLFVFWRLHVMVGLATAIGSVAGCCAFAVFLFATSKAVQWRATQIMAVTILSVLVVSLYSLSFPAGGYMERTVDLKRQSAAGTWSGKGTTGAIKS